MLTVENEFNGNVLTIFVGPARNSNVTGNLCTRSATLLSSTLLPIRNSCGEESGHSRDGRDSDMMASQENSESVSGRILRNAEWLFRQTLPGNIICHLARANYIGKYRNRNNGRVQIRIDDEFLKKVSGIPDLFRYKDLKSATNNFSNEIGKGGFGSVFHGTLTDGTKVAVKRLHNVEEGRDGFIAEVSTLACVNHFNLVRLLGICAEGSRCLLVYEFMDNGSLHDWLFSPEKESLKWKTRYDIALHTARGLAYLHEDSSSRILHLDVKPQNILLDENFRAKVSDFGLAKLLSKDESRVMTMHVRGTPGYIAPECMLEYAITAKSDVYSYGIVLLEMVSGRRVVDKSQDSQNWYFPFVTLGKSREGKQAELFDSRLGQVSAEEAAEMEKVIKLALWCIQNNSALRPKMSIVVQILEGSVEMLDPPLNFSSPFGPSLDDNHYHPSISTILEKSSAVDDPTSCSSPHVVLDVDGRM